MPYKSLAQERWAHTPAGTRALGGKAKVAEWDSATKGHKLPKRKGKSMARVSQYNGDVTQHQEYAITGQAPQGETFGVKKHSHSNGRNHNDGAHRKPALRDGGRGVPKHNGYHPLPDHGPFE